mmetsp:Transcript_85604/g.261865  ORF Transcript_85604/g.261865 Transcript_85604/m.261865 type:complete len:202 (+) Transcript_85604:1307-1912(+)
MDRHLGLRRTIHHDFTKLHPQVRNVFLHFGPPVRGVLAAMVLHVQVAPRDAYIQRKVLLHFAFQIPRRQPAHAIEFVPHECVHPAVHVLQLVLGRAALVASGAPIKLLRGARARARSRRSRRQSLATLRWRAKGGRELLLPARHHRDHASARPCADHPQHGDGIRLRDEDLHGCHQGAVFSMWGTDDTIRRQLEQASNQVA